MSPPAIETRGLVKRFGDLTAVRGVDLVVPEGQCLGVIGPNGAGKTTTLEMIEGLQDPSEGEVRIFGKTWREARVELRSRVGVQFQMQMPGDRMTVREIVRLFRSFHSKGLEVNEAIALVQLEAKSESYICDLSGGQAQRVGIALALVGNPDLLFLDEPSTGLDPQSRRSIWSVIERLRQLNKTVVLTTHYMDEVERLCDRVVVLDGGRIIADGAPAELVSSIVKDQIVDVRTASRLNAEVIASLPGVNGTEPLEQGLRFRVDAGESAVPRLFAALLQQQVVIDEITTRRPNLEDVFLTLTGHPVREGS